MPPVFSHLVKTIGGIGQPEALHKVVEGSHSRHIARFETGEDCPDRKCLQLFDPVVDGTAVIHLHQQERAKHGNGLAGWGADIGVTKVDNVCYHAQIGVPNLGQFSMVKQDRIMLTGVQVMKLDLFGQKLLKFLMCSRGPEQCNHPTRIVSRQVPPLRFLGRSEFVKPTCVLFATLMKLFLEEKAKMAQGASLEPDVF